MTNLISEREADLLIDNSFRFTIHTDKCQSFPVADKIYVTAVRSGLCDAVTIARDYATRYPSKQFHVVDLRRLHIIYST